MKKILIFVGMFVFAFGFVSCSKDSGGGSSGNYMVQINILGMPTCSVGDGREFLVKLLKNGKEVDPSDVTVSTFKDSAIGNLKIWNDGGTINIQGSKITKKYGEITGCKIGVVSASGSGDFGLKATYKGISATATLTLETD